MMDADYFIRKFESIPLKRWTTGIVKQGKRMCVLGHCGVRNYRQTLESLALIELIKKSSFYPILKQNIHIGLDEFAIVWLLNDNGSIVKGNNPKERMLNVMYQIKKETQIDPVEEALSIINELLPEIELS
jgi:hypothetical protein